ncbi:MAG: thioredoxin domain-containing protein [Burkholderiales bacterium]
MPNRLASETSPYLQQHAGNPVDWHAWNDEALAVAKRDDKPILLSIGYSACHWCHVMAHESFEDAEIAGVMNKLFVNIKVDREERPDLDQIYQTAHAMLTQRNGGWPLTMFLMPDDQTPFFAGTYFPKTARYGLTGFRDVLTQIADAYRQRRADIDEQNASLKNALRRTQPAAAGQHIALSDVPITAAFDALRASFDSRHGGFGDAPKFPHPVELEFLLRRYAADKDADALAMVRTTLGSMAEGGIYDQLGGGFARYSVDRFWMIPHFEKMLYDNGPLLRLYADAFLAVKEPLFAQVVEGTAQWVLREMQSPEGGYYSTIDADSEHEEGKFYVWTTDEVRGLLSADEYAVAAPHYGLDRPANFEGKDWHLRVVQGLDETAAKAGKPLEQCENLLALARAKLFAEREKRVHPGRDEKILTSWNALMIKGMARAARVFGRADWLASAERAAGFVRGVMWRDRKLLATYKSVPGRSGDSTQPGRAHLNAYLDDHAFLLDALLELLQARFRSDDLDFAQELADALLERFEDNENGGFFFTSHDHEQLIHRPKPCHDNATPSGNGIAAYALSRFGHLVGEPRYIEAAERALQLFYPAMQRQPGGFTSLAIALEEALEPPRIVILRGQSTDDLAVWQRALQEHYLPNTVTLAIPAGAKNLPAALDKPGSETVNAWVCHGVTCLPPIDDLATLIDVCKNSDGV